MRDTKFRAWCHKRKEWYRASDPDSLTFYGFHLFGECTLLCSPMGEDLQYLEITQYTGLKDKNNKDIYEGDIVVLKAPWGGFQAEIIFDCGCFGVQDGGTVYTFQDVSSNSLEIIGNIYENPKLLIDEE